MNSGKSTLAVPLLMIVVGIGWLLSTLGIFPPEINWIWTAGLAAAGIMPFAVSGVDKVNVVVGPWFLSASVLSVLRQSGQLAFDVEVPILVIIGGLLMIVARSATIPSPKWIIDDVSQSPRTGIDE
jgi:hypothetical protein